MSRRTVVQLALAAFASLALGSAAAAQQYPETIPFYVMRSVFQPQRQVLGVISSNNGQDPIINSQDGLTSCVNEQMSCATIYTARRIDRIVQAQTAALDGFRTDNAALRDDLVKMLSAPPAGSAVALQNRVDALEQEVKSLKAELAALEAASPAH